MSLKDELINGPLAAEIAPFIAFGNDTAISDILNRKDIATKGVILSRDIKQYLSLIGLRLPIMDSIATSCREASLALNDFDSFDLSKAMILDKFTAILDSLVAEPSVQDFTETHKLAILSLADKLISRSEQIGLHVDQLAIAQALRG